MSRGIGFAVRFIAAEVVQSADDPIAMLVRGEERHGNLDLLSRRATPTPQRSRRDATR